MSLSKEIQDFVHVYTAMRQARRDRERDRLMRERMNKPGLFDPSRMDEYRRGWRGPTLQTPGLEPGGAGGGAGKNVQFNDTHTAVMKMLTNRGVKPEVAAGAIGSLMGESGRGLDPFAYNPNDMGSPSGGIAQWHKERFQNLLAGSGLSPQQAVQNGRFMVPLDQQVSFLGHELDTSENLTLKQLQKADTLEQGNIIWTHGFERPQNASQKAAERLPLGQAFWQHYSTAANQPVQDAGTPTRREAEAVPTPPKRPQISGAQPKNEELGSAQGAIPTPPQRPQIAAAQPNVDPVPPNVPPPSASSGASAQSGVSSSNVPPPPPEPEHENDDGPMRLASLDLDLGFAAGGTVPSDGLVGGFKMPKKPGASTKPKGVSGLLGTTSPLPTIATNQLDSRGISDAPHIPAPSPVPAPMPAPAAPNPTNQPVNRGISDAPHLAPPPATRGPAIPLPGSGGYETGLPNTSTPTRIGGTGGGSNGLFTTAPKWDGINSAPRQPPQPSPVPPSNDFSSGYEDGGLVEEEAPEPEQEPAIPLPPRRPDNLGAPTPTPPRRPPELSGGVTTQGNAPQQPEFDNPIEAILNGLGSAIEAGLSGLQEMFGLSQAQGAMPNSPAMGEGLKRWFSGEGAATPQEMKVLGQAVDPGNELTEGMRNAYAMNEMYKHYVQQGDMKSAQRSAQAIIQYSRLLTSQYADQALKLFKAGDMQGGMEHLKKAQDAIPDGTTADTQPLEDGTVMVTQKDARGKQIRQIRVTPQQILAAAVGLKTGEGYWHQLGLAAQGGALAYREAPQASEAYRQWQEGGGAPAAPSGRPAPNSPAIPPTPAPATSGGNDGFVFNEPEPQIDPNLPKMSSKEQRDVRGKYNIDHRAWSQRRAQAEREFNHDRRLKETQDREDSRADRTQAREDARITRQHEDEARRGAQRFEAPERITDATTGYGDEDVDAALGFDPDTTAKVPGQQVNGLRQIYKGFRQFNHHLGLDDGQYARATKLLVSPSEGATGRGGEETTLPFRVEMLDRDPYGRVKITFNSEDMPETLYLPQAAFRQAMIVRGLAAQEQRSRMAPAQKQTPQRGSIRPW